MLLLMLSLDDLELMLSLLHTIMIVHIVGKQNVIVDALSWWPRVSIVSIAYNRDLTCMIEGYVEDRGYKFIMAHLDSGKSE